MYEILAKEKLNDSIYKMDIKAPLTAKKARAGQFIIFRINETGERVPLTVAAANAETGSVTIIFQTLGSSTKKLASKNVGETILDFAGPLGCPSEINGVRNAIVVGGGVGLAIAYPVAKELKEEGAKVTIIAGFRNKEIVFFEEETKKACDRLILTTDDGSCGRKGFVTDALKELLDEGGYDRVFAVGPLPMMKAVSSLTKNYGVKTIVSLNPIMVDGTGMCGGCRVTVGGKIKFACVDGPEFDGHEVDFDELMIRNRAHDEIHSCKIGRNNAG